MDEMEKNTGEGKDLAEANERRDSRKRIQFAKCFYMKRNSGFVRRGLTEKNMQEK